MTLHLSSELLAAIRAQGEAAYPEEGAGLLLGTYQGDERRVERWMPLANRFQPESRHNRYLITPVDMLAAEDEADRLGLEVVGVFHSHPDHPALASEFDRRWALPLYSYLITRVAAGKAVESRAWRLTEDRSQMVEEVLAPSLSLMSEERR